MQEISSRHKAAREWAEAGIPVFPCIRDGKRPACENGYKDSTTDLNQIDAWWSQDDYNPAVCPAMADPPLSVVDVEAAGLADWLAEHGTIPTRTHRTRAGGIHLWFEGACKTTARSLGPNIDTRSIGGYVLIPPSVVGGQPYEVISDHDPISLPSFVTDRIGTATQRHESPVEDLDGAGNIARARRVLTDYTQRGDIAKEGCGGDDRTFRVACELSDLGLSQEMALALLEEIWNPACQPPWDSEELAVKVANAYTYAQNETGAYATAPAGETFTSDAVKHAINSALSAEKATRSWFRTPAEYAGLPDPTWLFPDLLMDSSVALLVAAPNVGKTFSVVDLSCCALTGHVSAFGMAPLRIGPVVYACGEGELTTAKWRIPAWAHDRGFKLEDVPILIGETPLLKDDASCQAFLEAIRAQTNGVRPSMVVLDTLSTTMAGLDETRDGGMFVRFARQLSKALDCLVLVLHHFGHDKTKGARGGTVYPGNFDTVLEMEKVPGDESLLTVRVTKHRDAELPRHPWVLRKRKVGQGAVLDHVDQSERLAALADADPFDKFKVARVLLALGATPGNPISSDVLIGELLPHLQDETDSERQTAIGRARKDLLARANRLEMYCARSGRDLVWFLPNQYE